MTGTSDPPHWSNVDIARSPSYLSFGFTSSKGRGIAPEMRRIWQLSQRSFLAIVSIRVNKAFDIAGSASG
ncbi:hypothetical protein HGG76_02365 [Ochrobactrum tritici]|nr:hypothetical protein [Brucella tritici]